MKLAILACIAALCLAAPPAQAAPGEPAASEPAKDQGKPAPKPAAAHAETKVEPKSDKPAVVGRERRRRSYAACNRASHQRGYHGGKRRRFLIRCRLGYERTRTPPHQQAPAPPVPPATKP